MTEISEKEVRAVADVLLGRVNAPEQEIYRAARDGLEAAARVRAEANAEPVAWGEEIDGKIVSVRLDKSQHCTVPLYRAPQPSGPVEALGFDALRQANVARQKEWPGNGQADIAFRAIEVAGEAGEVLEAVKKFLRAERGIRGSSATAEDIAAEMADTIIALDLLANQIGVDLGAAVAKKFNATSEKYDLATRLSAPTAGKPEQAVPSGKHWFAVQSPTGVHIGLWDDGKIAYGVAAEYGSDYTIMELVELPVAPTAGGGE